MASSQEVMTRLQNLQLNIATQFYATFIFHVSVLEGGYLHVQTKENGFRNNGFRNNGFRNNGFRNNGFRNNGFRNNGLSV